MSDTRIDLLFLSEPDTVAAGVTDIAACIDVMAETLRLFAVGDYRLSGPQANAQGINLTFPAETPFPRMPVAGPDRRFAAMPAYLGGDVHFTGVKWYGSNVANKEVGLPRSIHTIVLNDPDTGAPVAVMAGNLVSAYRTAAVPGVGARYLAAANAREVAIIGPGAMNSTSLDAFVAVRPGLERVRVVGRAAASLERYLASVRARHPQLDVSVANSVSDAVANADIVSVATVSPAGSANYPYLDERWLKPGAFVSLPANVRLDAEFLTERAHAVLDSRGIFQTWAKGYTFPTHESFGFMGMQLMDLVAEERLDVADIAEIGEIVAGTRPGRTDEERIHVFGFGGLPIEDVAWGAHVYRAARRAGIGTPLNFWREPFLA
ncbi:MULTISPECIES: tyramine oxidase subunit B [Labedella]|uniref:tyramine oxidase subunit B n=1 Tax=Labedella TaxID=390250 RepID=UPI001FB7C7E2|nr:MULTISPECIES: tyramine oxidase subunit B [Labedella]